jgi:hypothetical protein
MAATAMTTTLMSAAMFAPAATAVTDPVQNLSGTLAHESSITSGVPALAPAGVTAAIPAAAIPPAAVPAAVPQVISPARAIAVKQSAFLKFTVASKETLDRRGIQPSLYRGSYFRSSLEETRKCIVRRESSGVYNVRGGIYYGAYQMNDRLADGATWMMLPEAKRLIGERNAKALMAKLRAKPVTAWPRYWQDAAFFTIYNWERIGSGRAHWGGGRWRC